MRLTMFTDFGLRAMMRMAGEPDRGFSTADLSHELKISRHHLMKIVQRLASAGYVQTRRGAGGGVMLARCATEIRLGDLVRLLEQGQPLVECFSADGGDCTLTGNCQLKYRLRAAETAFIDHLNRSTLAQIAIALPQGVAA